MQQINSPMPNTLQGFENQDQTNATQNPERQLAILAAHTSQTIRPITLEKRIFLKNKDKMYDQNLTLIPMVQTVFEIFMILSKIIQLQNSLHSERIFQSTITLLDPNSP